MAFGLGFILGPFVGGVLSDKSLVPWFSLATPLWTAAILSAINISFLLLFFHETLRRPKKARMDVLAGFRNLSRAFAMRGLRTVFLVVLLLGLGFNFFTQFFQVFLIDKFSYSASQVGKLFAYIGLWTALSQGVVLRPLSHRFSSPWLLRYASLGLALSLPFLLIPSKAAFLFLILPFVAVFQGLTRPNARAILSNQASDDSQGEIMGITQSMDSLALAIPPIISGIVVTLHRSLPILIAAATIFAGWLVFLSFQERHGERFGS